MYRVASLVVVAACTGGSGGSATPAVAPVRVANGVTARPDAARPDAAPAPDAPSPDPAVRPGFASDGLVHVDDLNARDRFHYEEQMRHQRYALAAQAFMDKRYSECATLFTAIYADTNDLPMLFNVALCHQFNGERETALAEFEQLVGDKRLPADLRKTARKAIRSLKAALRRR